MPIGQTPLYINRWPQLAQYECSNQGQYLSQWTRRAPHPMRLSHSIRPSIQSNHARPRRVKHRVSHSKRASSVSGGTGSLCAGTLQGRTMAANRTPTPRNRCNRSTTNSQTSSTASHSPRTTPARVTSIRTRRPRDIQPITTDTRRTDSLKVPRQRLQKTGYLRPGAHFRRDENQRGDMRGH